MASFVIHNIAGTEMLNILKNKLGYEISPEDERKFLVGNLIPDSSNLQFPSLDPNLSKEELIAEKDRRSQAIQTEKQITHFRPLDEADKNVQTPQLEAFIEKYHHLFPKDMSVLGYLFHLYTDKLFFGNLFNSSFIFLDANHHETDCVSDTKCMLLKRDGKTYDVREIFSQDSETSIYRDYTRMNTLLLNKYHATFDAEALLRDAENITNPGIEEVNYSNVRLVIIKTARFIEESQSLSDYTLRVFKQEDVEDFIRTVTESFILAYQREIDASLKKPQKPYVPKKVPTPKED